MNPHEQQQADEPAAEEYAESDFLERRGFCPEDITWRDDQYGAELRSAKFAYLAGLLAERSRAEAKLALAVEALEEIVGVYYARGEHTYGGYKHQKIACPLLSALGEKPALTPEQKWAYGAGPGTLAGMRICEI